MSLVVARVKTMVWFLFEDISMKKKLFFGYTIKPCNDEGRQGENEAGCDGHQGKPLLREALARD